MKKIRLKKSIKGKLVLFFMLAIAMTGLIVGELAVRGKSAEAAPPALPETEASEAASEPAPENTTAPPETTVPTTAETTAAPAADTTIPPATAGTPVTVDPTGENWALVLVNLNHRLPENYVPSLANAIAGSSIQLDARIAEFYQKMYDAAKNDGCVLTPYSGYCSFSRQNDNYNRKVNYFINQGFSSADAQARANTTILPAGCSEHNLGLSIDIVTASTDFASTKEFSWLVENAHSYGFILRYPADKTEKTGVNYQPWHWRYVGTDAAKEMKTKNLCLEEYLPPA